MSKLFLATIAGVVLAAVLASCANQAVASYFEDPARLERERVQTQAMQQSAAQALLQRQQDDQRRAEFMQTVTPFVALAVIGLLVFGLAFVVATGCLAIVGRWYMVQAERGRLRPQNGMVSVSLAHSDQAALMGVAGYHQAQIETAKQPRLPADLRTYSPRYVTNQRGPQDATAPTVAAALAPPDITIHAPTFADLLTSHQVGNGRLLLGYTEAGPLVGSWKDLYSTAVGGVSGSGKTTTTRFLAAQSAMMGARFVVIDPHADAGDDSLAATLAPLAPSFIADPASDGKAMRAVIRRVADELDERMQSGRKAPPLVVCVDEFTSLMRGPVGDDLAALVERIGQEGRKYGVFALLSGQIWTGTRSGGTELRDSLASAFVHRLKPAQARLLVPDIDRGVARLPVGHCFLNRTNGDLVHIAIPQTTAQDLEAVARLMPSQASAPRPMTPVSDFDRQPAPVARPPLVVLPGGGGGGMPDTPTDEPNEAETAISDTTTTTTTYDPDSERRRRVLELHEQGVSKSSICQVLWGYKDTRVMAIVSRVIGEASDQAQAAND